MCTSRRSSYLNINEISLKISWKLHSMLKVYITFKILLLQNKITLSYYPFFLKCLFESHHTQTQAHAQPINLLYPQICSPNGCASWDCPRLKLGTWKSSRSTIWVIRAQISVSSSSLFPWSLAGSRIWSGAAIWTSTHTGKLTLQTVQSNMPTLPTPRFFITFSHVSVFINLKYLCIYRSPHI